MAVVGLFVVALALALGHVTFFDLVWDDYMFLHQTSKYVSADTWFDAAFSSFFISSNYFRPLPLGTYRLDVLLYGNASGYHTSQLLYYILAFALVAVAVYKNLHRYVAEEKRFMFWCGCFAGALLLALHPANVESAAWVSCRFEVLLLIFSALLFIAVDHEQVTPLRLVAVAICYLCACFSKETAVILPLLLGLKDIFEFRLRGGTNIASFAARVWRSYVAIVLAGVIYLVVRYVCLGYILVQEPGGFNQYGSWYQQLLAIGSSFGYYLALFFTPFYSVQPVYDFSFPIDPTDIRLALIAWLSIAVVVLSVISAWKMSSRLGLCLVAFFLALLPFLHFIPLMTSMNLLQTRFILIPSVFVAILLGTIVVALWQNAEISKTFKQVLSVSFLVWIAACAVNGRSVSYMWSNNLSLWQWANEVAPLHPSAVVNYASSLQRFGRPEEAVRFLERVLPRRNNWTIQTFGTYASALTQVGRTEDALRVNLAVVQDMLGAIQARMGQPETAATRYFEAFLSEVYVDIALLMNKQQLDKPIAERDYEEQLVWLSQASRIGSWSHNYHRAAADTNLIKGDFDEADRQAELYLEKADPKAGQAFMRRYQLKRKSRWAELQADQAEEITNRVPDGR